MTRYKIGNKTTYKYFLFLFLFTLTYSSSAQQKRVVGYLPSYRFNYNSSISYCKITHLNICFANPDSAGNFVIDDFTEIIKRAKSINPNIVICISIGGGGLSELQKEIWSNLIDKPANRPKVISKLLSFVNKNNLDGVDVDLEWSAVTSGYTDFVISLSDSLHAANKIMTSALPGTYRYSQVTQEVLWANNFINIMAYDETGPWDPKNPGQHSSYNFALRSLQFWKDQGVESDKLTLGVPFYGYNFSGNTVTEFKYSNVVDIDIKYADLDKMNNAYYNGRPTIRKKVELAAEEASGIMIWELSQDRFDEYSLLKTIHDKFTSLGDTTTGLCGNLTSINTNTVSLWNIYPNPASSVVYIENAISRPVQIEIFNSFGQKMQTTQNSFNDKTEINITDFKSGIYIIRITDNHCVMTKKLIVQK